MAILTPPQICGVLNRLRPRVTAYRWSVHRRAVQAYARAFGRQARPGDCLNACVIHNAIVDRDRGRPWPDVDYSQLRQARYLLGRQFDADRLVDRLYLRLVRQWQSAGYPTSNPCQSV
jgi:hypothetical protein